MPISSAIPYQEPGIITILILSTFILLSNAIGHVLDSWTYCGLVGQILVGVAWGTPGTKWLDENVQHAVIELGYLGLILLVYEGGLGTNLTSTRQVLLLSSAVAITGIAVPIALSFSLRGLANANPLQAFAAGAALCSTSLGTTFTLVKASGLSSSRLATVLTSAAMMDDVVGLVMIQVISNLGATGAPVKVVTVVRPIAVSVGFVLALTLGCYLIVRPLRNWLNAKRQYNPNGLLDRTFRARHMDLIAQTSILLGLVTGATYSGTSNLFAAYLAGACISWWDSEMALPVLSCSCSDVIDRQTRFISERPDAQHVNVPDPTEVSETRSPAIRRRSTSDSARGTTSSLQSGQRVYHIYYLAAVQRILKPFFFVGPTPFAR